MADTKQSRRDDGSIFRHPDGKRWFARLQYIDANGRRTQKKRICKSHEAAKKKLNDLRGEVENDQAGRHTYRELDAFYRKHFVHAAKFDAGGKLLSGFRGDLDAVNHYLDQALEVFGDRFLDEITYSDLREYKQSVADRPIMSPPDKEGRRRILRQRSVSDINHHMKRLRRVLAIAVENGWLDKTPFHKGGALIIESFEVERTRILSPAEETKLLAACDRWRKHLRPVIIFAIETALRRGELQRLRWSSIDLAGRYLRVESSNAKTLRSRLVPLTARAADVLALAWQNSAKRQTALVFGASDFKKGFRNAAADAGLFDVHFHDLRHTAITRMLERGISPPLVMKISGHTQQKTFLRYVNQSETSIREIAEQLDAAAYASASPVEIDRIKIFKIAHS